MPAPEYQLQELQEQRANIIEEARKLHQKATEEKRDLNEEEQREWDKRFDEADKLQKRIDRERKLIEEDRAKAEREAQANANRSKPDGADDDDEGRDRPGNPENRDQDDPQEAERREAFRRFLTGGLSELRSNERRALQADSVSGGGFIVTPRQFVNELIKEIDNETFVRSIARVFPVEGTDSLGAPTLDTDVDDADWTPEIGEAAETDMKFGERELHPKQLTKLVKVSEKLLRVGAMNPEALVRNRLAYKFGVTLEKAFLTGSGAGEPLGVFTVSDNGIPTSRDVSTGNTATEIKFDGLIEAMYSVKGQYWNRAQWLFHRDGVKQIAKVKDGEGRYLWSQSVREGEPDTLRGRPVRVSEYVPNTFTSGQYVGIFGAFEFYWIAELAMLEMKRLDELYANKGQVGFRGRLWADGQPVLGEAFARVKLG